MTSSEVLDERSPARSVVDRYIRSSWVLLGFAPFYMLSVAIGYGFYFSGDNVSAFWPASGVAIAGLILTPARRWWIVIGLMACCDLIGARFLSEQQWWDWSQLNGAHAVEALLGAVLYRRIVGPDQIFATTLRQTASMTLLVAGLAPAVGAALGTSAYMMLEPGVSFWAVFQVWWLSNFLGVLIVTPTILAQLWGREHAASRPSRGGRLELAVYGVLLMLVCHLVLGGDDPSLGWLGDMGYVIFPLLMWSSLRFDYRVMTLSTSLVAVLAVGYAKVCRGPFLLIKADSFSVLALNLQAFLITAIVSATWIKAAIVEHEEADRRMLAFQTRSLEAQRRSAVAEVASAAAHDFNNQLMVLQVTLDLLSHDDEEARGEGLVEMQSALGDASTLARQLLMLSREEPSGGARCDAQSVIMRQLPLMRQQLEGVEVELSLDEVPDVSMSESELGRVVLNLVINARDAMPSGGVLRIGLRGAAGRVILSVADTGVGMSERVLARAFDPFFTTKGAGGTGLGLASVHAAVTAVGGEIEGTSREGVGTRFEITLPRA